MFKTLFKTIGKIIKDLFQEFGSFSLSRLSFAITPVSGLCIAFSKGDIPPGVVTVIGTLLVYVFSSKTGLNLAAKMDAKLLAEADKATKE